MPRIPKPKRICTETLIVESLNPTISRTLLRGTVETLTINRFDNHKQMYAFVTVNIDSPTLNATKRGFVVFNGDCAIHNVIRENDGTFTVHTIVGE